MTRLLDNFLRLLAAWYAANQRTLPFRGEKDPYKIWVSEVLLQQTQMSRGVPYYQRCIEKFPTISELAKTSWDDFLPYFRGLGYYNRGRNMLRAAQYLMEHHAGVFPQTFDELVKIPGVGPYTANAILSFAYGHPVLTGDTNVTRILSRVFGIEKDDKNAMHTLVKKVEEFFVMNTPFEKGSASKAGGFERNDNENVSSLSDVQESNPLPCTRSGTGDNTSVSLLNAKRLPLTAASINQAMMDLGSAICTTRRPKCEICPLLSICAYGQKAISSPQPSPLIAKRLPLTASSLHISLIHDGSDILLFHHKLPSIKKIPPGGSDSPTRGGESRRGVSPDARHGRSRSEVARHLLKDLILSEHGLEISVRPPFLTWTDGDTRYSAHRCYILQGDIPADAVRMPKRKLTTPEDILLYLY